MKKSFLLLIFLGFSAFLVSAKNKIDPNYTAEMVYNFTAENINTITPDELKDEVSKLSIKEKRKLFTKVYNKFTSDTKNKKEVDKVALYILAIFLPPVAIGLHTNWDATPTLINLVLTLLIWLPGIVHAFYIISTY